MTGGLTERPRRPRRGALGLLHDLPAVRAAFPALASGYLFADNAGGSQCLAAAAHAITDYLLNTNVQLGADYAVSLTSTQRVAAGAEAARELFNADSADEVAYGSSSTMLVENLARALEADVLPGEEIVIYDRTPGRPCKPKLQSFLRSSYRAQDARSAWCGG